MGGPVTYTDNGDGTTTRTYTSGNGETKTWTYDTKTGYKDGSTPLTSYTDSGGNNLLKGGVAKTTLTYADLNSGTLTHSVSIQNPNTGNWVQDQIAVAGTTSQALLENNILRTTRGKKTTAGMTSGGLSTIAAMSAYDSSLTKSDIEALSQGGIYMNNTVYGGKTAGSFANDSSGNLVQVSDKLVSDKEVEYIPTLSTTLTNMVKSGLISSSDASKLMSDSTPLTPSSTPGTSGPNFTGNTPGGGSGNPSNLPITPSPEIPNNGNYDILTAILGWLGQGNNGYNGNKEIITDKANTTGNTGGNTFEDIFNTVSPYIIPAILIIGAIVIITKLIPRGTVNTNKNVWERKTPNSTKKSVKYSMAV